MPGLVTLYDIRPGNGAGLFLQPKSPHGAPTPVCSTPPVREFPLEFCNGDSTQKTIHAHHQTICAFISIQFQSVTDRQISHKYITLCKHRHADVRQKSRKT